MEDVVTAVMETPLADDLEQAVAATHDLWDELRGARVFVTGGTGFFGRWILEMLLWASARRRLGATVTVLTRNAAGFSSAAPHLAGHSAVTLQTGDVRDFAFPAGSFSHVIHAGCRHNTGRSRLPA